VIGGAARRGRQHPGGFLVCLMLTINIAWFPKAGTYGSPLLYWVIPTYYAVVFFTGRRRAVVLAGVILNAVALMGVEYMRPDLLGLRRQRRGAGADLARRERAARQALPGVRARRDAGAGRGGAHRRD